MQPDLAALQAQIAQMGAELGVLQNQLRVHRHDGNMASRMNDSDIFKNKVALPLPGSSGAVVFDPSASTVFTVTPTGNITSLKPSFVPNGGLLTLVIETSGTTSYTITFDVGFTATGTLSTGTVSGVFFTITFACDGVNLREVARTAAMTPS